jgi:hypothetical protein
MPAVNIDADVYAAFTAAVHGKHGKLRGVLQEEATAALRAHLSRLPPAALNGHAAKVSTRKP